MLSRQAYCIQSSLGAALAGITNSKLSLRRTYRFQAYVQLPYVESPHSCLPISQTASSKNLKVFRSTLYLWYTPAILTS